MIANIEDVIVDTLFLLNMLFSTDNDIREIQGLSNCRRLEYLSLRNNKIDRIQGLDCLPLKYLNLVNNNNNNNNKHDNVYGAVIMAEPLREFTRFIW